MKKLLFLLVIPLFFACGSDDDNKDGDGLEIQDYTSFVIENKYSERVDLFYVIVAYKDKSGTFHKVADIGHLQGNKPSGNIKMDAYHQSVRLFCVLERITDDNIFFYDFDIKENRKNILKLEDSMQWTAVNDQTDPTQYPQ